MELPLESLVFLTQVNGVALMVNNLTWEKRPLPGRRGDWSLAVDQGELRLRNRDLGVNELVSECFSHCIVLDPETDSLFVSADDVVHPFDEYFSLNLSCPRKRAERFFTFSFSHCFNVFSFCSFFLRVRLLFFTFSCLPQPQSPLRFLNVFGTAKPLKVT